MAHVWPAGWSPELWQADLEAVQQHHYREGRLRHRQRRDAGSGARGGARQDWQRDGDGDSEGLRQVGCRAARLGQAGGLPCNPGRAINPSSSTIPATWSL